MKGYTLIVTEGRGGMWTYVIVYDGGRSVSGTRDSEEQAFEDAARALRAGREDASWAAATLAGRS